MLAQPSANNNGQVVVLLLADIAQLSRLWGWTRIVKGPQGLQDTPGLLFSKVMGSGYEGGFGLRPSPSRQGVFGLFESLQTAQEFLASSSLLQDYQQRSDEFFWVILKTWSCRGSWDGQSLDVYSTTHQGACGSANKGLHQAGQSARILAACTSLSERFKRCQRLPIGSWLGGSAFCKASYFHHLGQCVRYECLCTHGRALRSHSRSCAKRLLF